MLSKQNSFNATWSDHTLKTNTPPTHPITHNLTTSCRRIQLTQTQNPQSQEYEPIFAARAAFQAFPPTHHQLLAMRARRRPAPTDDDEVDEIGDDTRQEAFMAESKFGGGRDPRFEKPMGRP